MNEIYETDEQYIERCLNGYPENFRYLVRRYQAVLLAYLVGKLGNRDSAEEAAQETFVRAYFNMDRLNSPSAFFSWLLGISDRVAKEHQRKEKIRRQREVVHSYSEEAGSPELSQDYALEAAIDELPETYRRVVLLRYYGSYSCSQIAEKFGMPLGTVTKILSRAYVMLRKSLQQKNNNEVHKV